MSSDDPIPVGRRRAAAEQIRARRREIAERVTAVFLDRHPDWIDRYGDLARVRGEEDAGYHVDFLAGAVLAGDTTAFRDYARWTAGVLAARGIAPEHLAENLEAIGGEAVRGLSAEAGRLVATVVRAGVDGAATARDGPGDGATPTGKRSQPDGAVDLRAERSTYLQAIRAGDRRAALAVALESLRAGRTVPHVYRDILQPAQYELGRLWERNEITVAQEHMATAVTQYVVAQLYSRLDIPEPRRGRAIVTGVSGELHQIGPNMVADVLEADGWNTRFLGTQLPHRGVLQAIEEHEPRILGISATVLFNLPAVADLIDDTRRLFGSGITVLVGGAAFRHADDAWRDMGADGHGRDLHDAVRMARDLTAGDA